MHLLQTACHTAAAESLMILMRSAARSLAHVRHTYATEPSYLEHDTSAAMSAGRRRRPWRIRRALRAHRARTKCCSGSPRDRRAFRFGWPGSLSAGAACRAVQVPARRTYARIARMAGDEAAGRCVRTLDSGRPGPLSIVRVGVQSCCCAAEPPSPGVCSSLHDVHFACKHGGLKLENRRRSRSFSPSRLTAFRQ
jgi:hypothetical protein